MNELSPELQEFEQYLRSHQPASLTPQILSRSDLELFGASLAQVRPSPIPEEAINRIDTELLQAELSNLTPRSLEKSFLDQLDNIPTSAGLTDLQPASMSEDLLDRLTQSALLAEQSNTTSEDNIVAFPSNTKIQKKKKNNWKWVTSAAAAACIGIYAGLNFSGSTPNDQSPIATVAPVNKQAEFISPENLQKVEFIEVEDRGIVPRQSSDPVLYRAVKVIQLETYQKIDENGQLIQYKRPVEKPMLIPVQPD